MKFRILHPFPSWPSTWQMWWEIAAPARRFRGQRTQGAAGGETSRYTKEAQGPCQREEGHSLQGIVHRARLVEKTRFISERISASSSSSSASCSRAPRSASPAKFPALFERVGMRAAQGSSLGAS